MWLSTGMTARMRNHQSKCWQAALLRLSGSAQLATSSGKHTSWCAPATGLVVPGALNEAKSSSLTPHFLKLSLPAWPSGTDAEDIYPDNITLGSDKLVHWICSCCPRGQPHHWTASPSRRIGSGSRCLVCAGRQACVCNSLGSLFPVIAAKFDVDKNGFGPSDITAGSNKKVWWRNAAVLHKAGGNRARIFA